MLTYTVIRDRRWIIRLCQMSGGYHYHAWQADIGYTSPPSNAIYGWSMGSWRDGLETAIHEIDVRQGKPSYCERPRRVKEVSHA